MAGCVTGCTMCRIELRCVLEAAAYGWLYMCRIELRCVLEESEK